MPFALAATVFGFTQGQLDFKTTIKTGSFVFVAKKLKSVNVKNPEGSALANSIFILRNPLSYEKKEILAHELIHTYQYESFSGINTYLNKHKKRFAFYDKLFYTDFNFLPKVIYNLSENHESNFFENEARYYSK